LGLASGTWQRVDLVDAPQQPSPAAPPCAGGGGVERKITTRLRRWQ
jgi:hypothetical protein